MSKVFRNSLSTELAKHIYDWCSIPKDYVDLENIKIIAESFCTREGYKLCQIQDYGSGIVSCIIDGEPSLEAYGKFRFAFEQHGHVIPLLGFVKV